MNSFEFEILTEPIERFESFSRKKHQEIFSRFPWFPALAEFKHLLVLLLEKDT